MSLRTTILNACYAAGLTHDGLCNEIAASLMAKTLLLSTDEARTALDAFNELGNGYAYIGLTQGEESVAVRLKSHLERHPV